MFLFAINELLMTEFIYNKKYAIRGDLGGFKTKDREEKYHLVRKWWPSKVRSFFMGHPVSWSIQVIFFQFLSNLSYCCPSLITCLLMRVSSFEHQFLFSSSQIGLINESVAILYRSRVGLLLLVDSLHSFFIRNLVRGVGLKVS